MIIGGQSSKVELYNYVSREQCLLQDMPKSNYQGNAAWLNNTAVVCDGHWVTANCTIFNQTSNLWIEVRLGSLKDVIYLSTKTLTFQPLWAAKKTVLRNFWKINIIFSMITLTALNVIINGFQRHMAEIANFSLNEF
jgi:hypothetical protein